MEQFSYLAFAEQEALLRFSQATQAEHWRWDLCYNLAFSHQSVFIEAPELFCYSKLIEEGLNSGQTNVNNLANWFAAHEMRFRFAITSMDPPSGYEKSHVITLEDNALLWLLEKSGKFQATGLTSSMFHYRESRIKFELLDLTGDHYPELVIDFGRAHCCGTASTQYVYDLSSGTPEQLSFENLSGISSGLSSDYDSSITSLAGDTKYPGLLFKGHYAGGLLYQPCDLRKYEKYYWNGYQFELVDTWFGIEEHSQYDNEEFCGFVIDTANEQSEINVAVKTIGDIRIDEPEVTKDQILYRLGEYHARLGNIDKAKKYFANVTSIESVDTSGSTWIQAAQRFLDGLQDKSDYYRLCSEITVCDTRDALKQILAEIEPEAFPLVFETLQSAGTSIKSSGFMNFDVSGDMEQWFVLQHPNRNQREFWILTKDVEKIDGLFVADISTNKPELREFQGNNLYELTTTDGKTLISLEKLRFTNQPYILTHDLIDNYDPVIEDEFLRSSFVEESLDHITTRLLSGADPTYIRELLIQFHQSNTVDCKESNVCDKIYYLLGLTSELLGDDQAAVQAYVQLWQEFPGSLYTIMARSKLEPVP